MEQHEKELLQALLVYFVKDSMMSAGISPTEAVICIETCNELALVKNVSDVVWEYLGPKEGDLKCQNQH